MLLDGGRISPEDLNKLQKYSDLLECECPNHLIAILNQVRQFEAYTTECIEKYPEDANTHKWLKSAAKNIDALLSNTIVQLARIEGFIDPNNTFVPREQVKKPEAESAG